MKTSQRLTALLLAALTVSPALGFALPAQAATALDRAPPDPVFTVSPGSGTTATLFELDGRGSHAPPGTQVLVDWGDGTLHANELLATHRYEREGDFVVRLHLRHDELGNASAFALVRVRAMEPAAWADRESDTLASLPILPNNAVLPAQAVGLAARGVGAVAVLVTGLEPRALPVGLAPSAPNLTYTACSEDACTPLKNLTGVTDPDGVSTGAFSVLLQKVLNATFHAIDVRGPDGKVTLRTLARAYEYAGSLGPVAVVSLLPPDAGFLDTADAVMAYNPDHQTGHEEGVEVLKRPERLAFLRALAANRAQYDFGDNGTYPVPNGYNETRAPHHDHGYGGGHHDGAAGGHGGYGRVLHMAPESCVPLPVPGPREDRPAQRVPTYQRFEDGLKAYGSLGERDHAILSPVESEALEALSAYFADVTCLHHALSHLAHQGIPIVVPAGDNAAHVGVADALNATWDLQGLRGIAEFPQVITVGATTSTASSYGAPDHGSRRVVLPTSAAGPTRALRHVKPDLLAPSDVPAALVGEALASGTWWAPERTTLHDTFRNNRTGAALFGNVTLADQALRLGASDDPTGVAYAGSRDLAPLPRLDADVWLRLPPAGNATRNAYRFAAQTGVGFDLSTGFGVEILPLADGRLNVTSLVRVNGTEYEACVGVCPPSVRTVTINAEPRLHLRVSAAVSARQDHNLLTFEVLGADGLVRATLAREMRVNATGHLCACPHVTFLSGLVRNGSAHWAEATLDDVTANGLHGPAQATYDDGRPIEDYGPAGVRPGTRYAAAYAAGLAIVHYAPLVALEPDPMARLVRLRGVLAGLSKPLDNVPPYVQGAGELSPDLVSAALLSLATEHQAAGVPGVDLGLRVDDKPAAHLTFHWKADVDGHQVDVQTTGIAWHRVDRDRNLSRVPDAVGLSALSEGSGTTREVTLSVTSLPSEEGVYAALLPVGIKTSLGLAHPLYAKVHLPVLLTKGVNATLDLSGLDAPPGAAAWLLPPVEGTHLVHDPLPGGPAAHGTLDEQRKVAFGPLAPAGYSLALAVSASLPVPDENAPNGTHEAGRPRDFVLVSRSIRPLHGTHDALVLDPSAGLPVPVAYRLLDIVQGTAFSFREADPRATNAQLFRGGSLPPRARWNQRGDPRPEGHALDEPLPVGDTPVGWDVRVVGRAPPVGVGNVSTWDARANYEDALAPGAHRPASLAGHLDPRPWILAGNATLPALVLETDVDLPRPLDSVHGLLLLPFEADETTALLRIAAGPRETTVLLTQEGAWVHGPPEGDAWTYPADRWDNRTDFHLGGVLAGWGHLHGHEGELRLVPRTPEGHLVPFAFHDLPADASEVTLSLLLRPHPTSLAGRAWSAGPLDPAPGPRFRLDGVALHAWTAGTLVRDRHGEAPLSLGSPARFHLPAGVQPDPLREPAIRVAPFHEGGQAQGEILEAYVRSANASLRLKGANVVDTTHPGVVRGVLNGTPAETLSFTHGRGVNSVFDPAEHPLAVLRPYAHATPLERPVHERFVDFASLGASLWRLDGHALLQAADASGSLRIQFSNGTAETAVDLAALPERFPDFADPALHPAHPPTDCAYGGVGLVGILVGEVAGLSCYLDVDGYSASYSTQRERDAAGLGRDAVNGTSTGCLDAYVSLACLGDVLEQVDVDGVAVRSRYASVRNATIAQGAVAPALTVRTLLWEGVVPPGGGLLVLEHAVAGSGSASVNATLPGDGVQHRLATLEGQDAFRASDPRLRPTRVDVYDLAGYASQRVRLDLVPENGASWSVASWRILPRATPALVDPVVGPHLLDESTPNRPDGVLRKVPSGTTVRAGPAQSERAATPGASLVHLANGLDVAGLVKLADRHLLVGRDADKGALLHVKANGTLVLERATLAPRALGLPWGIVVEDGGKLYVNDSTLLGGGHPQSGVAAIEVRKGGLAFVNDSDLVGGAGVLLRPGSALLSRNATYHGLTRAVEADSAAVTLVDAFVDANVQGVVARNATLKVHGGLFTSNREGALQLQDTLAAVSGATFAWNGEAGPRAAVSHHEGLDTGRVVLHDARFVDNARAVLARAPVDLRSLEVTQAAPGAVHAAPAATLRLDDANVTSTGGAALFLDAGSVLFANATTLHGALAVQCVQAPGFQAPALHYNDAWRKAASEGCPPPATDVKNAANLTDPAAWRAVVTRPFLREGPNPAFVLPFGADAKLVDLTAGDHANLTLGADSLTLGGNERRLAVVAATGAGAVVPYPWKYDLTYDKTAPAGALRFLAGTHLGEDGRRWLRAFSAPLAIDATDAWSGAGASALVLASRSPDGTEGVRNATVADGLRGGRAVLGQGAAAALAPVTGDEATLTPLLRDRAGNAREGVAVSVVYDRTPPRAWLHAANPCGDLFAYDLEWYAHDPQVGVGLRPAGSPKPDPVNNWTYVVSVASVNLSATVDLGDIDTLLEILDIATVDRLRQANPQALNAQALTELDRRLNDPLNGKWLTDLPLIDWIEVGRFTRDERGIRLSLVRNLSEFLDRNLNWTAQRAGEVLNSTEDVEDWLEAVRDARLEEIEAHERVNRTLDGVLPHLKDELENLRKLVPILLAVKVEARDAVGNTATWYEPVLSDVFSPTHLLYLLGDHVRERVMPMLLAPTASIDLHDLHGELAIFDPDCGLQEVTILERVPNVDQLAPLVTVHPREGRVTYNVSSVHDLFPANVCGEKDLRFVSKDVFGRASVVDTKTLLDRLAPLTTLVEHERVMDAPLLPVTPTTPPPGVNPSWINEYGFHVVADALSRNLPVCPTSAGIHDMRVEASVGNRTWVTLAREHYGAARNGTLVNTTVRLNATPEVNAKDFGMTDAEISGQWLSVRIRSSDEAGNDEKETNAQFGYWIDTKPPVCTLDHVGGRGGHTLPVAWTATDVGQTAPGEVTQAYLLVRPAPGHPDQTQVGYFLYAPFPSPQGAATLVLTNENLPAWAAAPILHDVELACAAYDQAGNLALGPAARTLLDLELPIVNWTTLAPAWANASVVLNWTVDEVVTGVDRVLVYSNETGHDLVLREEHDASVNGSYVLDPTRILGGELPDHDGLNWTVRVEAHDESGNRFARTHSVLFDTTPPTGNLTNVANALVGGFLPVSLYDFVPNLDHATTAPQSPFAARLEVNDAGVLKTFHLGTDGRFHLTFDGGGPKSMRLVPCDAAGNCGAPTAWLSFGVDLEAPTTTFQSLVGGLLPTSTLPGAGGLVSLTPHGHVYANFTVRDDAGEAQDPTNAPNLTGGERWVLQMDLDDHDQPTAGKTRDSAPGGKHATLTGAVATPLGRFGHGYAFTGAGRYVTVPDTGAMSQGTAMVWINPTQYGSRILFKQAPGVFNSLTLSLGADGRVDFNTDQTAPGIRSASVVPLNQWTHLAVSWGPGGERIYLNGNLDASNTDTTGVGSQYTQTMIGNSPNDINTGGFHGTLDEVRLHNVQLPQADVRALKDSPYVSAGSGVADLAVVARPLNAFTRQPNGTAVAVNATFAGLVPGGRAYNASFAALAPDQLYRFEVSARDAAGNSEKGADGGPVVVSAYFAHDGGPPTALLAGLPEFFNTPTLRVGATLRDDVDGLGVGVEAYEVHLRRDGGELVLRGSAAANGARWSNVTFDDAVATADEGLLLTYCVKARDRFGRVGSCDGEASATLDRTPPAVTLTLPTDALLDPFTNQLPVRVKAQVDNVAPRGRAAAVGEVFVELATSDLTRPPSFRVNLSANGQVLLANQSANVTFDLGASDGNVYLLGAFAGDLAGNRLKPGSETYAADSRNTTEVALHPFDAGDDLNDVSGNGNALSLPGASANRPAYSSSGRGGGGRSLSFDGGDWVSRAATHGFTDAMTAMAWVQPTSADQTAGILGRQYLGAGYGLWLENGYLKAALDTDVSRSVLTMETKLPVNAWSHVALVYDGSFLRLHVDGVEAAPPSPITGRVQESGTVFHVGAAYQSTTLRGWRGLVDEVRLYRTALTPSQIADAKDYPFLSAPRTVLHVDLTPPVSAPAPQDLVQALATVGVHAHDAGPGKHSGLKEIVLEERVLDTRSYVAAPVAKEGLLEIAQGLKEIPAGTDVRFTHPLRIPPGVTSVNVRLAVSDTIAQNANAPACSPAETNVGTRARWRVLVGGTELGFTTVGGNGVAESVYHLSSVAVTPGSTLDLALSLYVTAAWKACYPRLAVTFDEVTVRDAVTGFPVFADGFLDYSQWTLSIPSGQDYVSAGWKRPAPSWKTVSAPATLWSESWDYDGTQGWSLQTGADPLTGVGTVYGASDGYALRLLHEGTAGSGSTLYDRAGRAIPATDATHVFVMEKATRHANTRSRPGLVVDLEGTKSLVFQFESTMLNPLPTQVDAVTGRTYHFVDASAGRVPGEWNARLLDVAAAKAGLGLTGRVVGLHAYLEKSATPAPGETFGASLSLDDVRLLSSNRTRVDLPFKFPFYGQNHTTVYADHDGVLGFTPTFNGTPSAANFDRQALIAPAWGSWSLAGVDEWAINRPHGVYVDASVHNQTTILWTVGPDQAPGATDAFAVTLFETGEILTTYREVPDRANVFRIGISAGDGVRNLTRTDALPSLTDAEDGYLPGNGTWVARPAAAHGVGVPIATDLPVQLRTVAVDRADNRESAGGPRARVTRDSLPPLVSIRPVTDALGNLADRDLKIDTTVLDEVTHVQPGSVTLRIWNVSGSTSTAVTPPAPGKDVRGDAGLDVWHRSTYALNLSAKDRFGQEGWDNRTFQAVITPEPTLDLVRALEGATYLDDVLQGALPGQVGVVGGDRLSAAGSARVAGAALWLNVTLDAQSLAKGFAAAGSAAGLSFGTVADVAGLSAGEHTFRVRAETAAGSFAEANYTFRPQNATQVAANDVENDTAAWWRPVFASGDRADALAEAARRGALGIRVRSVDDATTVAFARHNLSAPVAAARHWAFVRVPAAPTGAGLDVLKLEASDGAAFTARVDATMVLWALSNGTWTNTTLSLKPGHWHKVEAADNGRSVALYLDNAFAGTHARTARGAVTALNFSAAGPAVAGDLHVDDLGVDRGDVVRRALVQDDFRSITTAGLWLPRNDSAFTVDSYGRRAMKIDSYADRNHTAALSVPVAPHLLVSLDVGLLGRGCAGTGHLLRLLDTADQPLLRLECSGVELRASDGAGLATVPLQLVAGRYDRLVAHVGPTSYTLFVNDRMAGVYALSSTLPAAKVRIGGGNAELWYNDLQLLRARPVVSDGFDDLLSSAWKLPPASATLEAGVSTEQAIVGNRSLKIRSSGALNEVGGVERLVAFPVRSTTTVRVHVPSTAAFEDFTVLALGNAAGPQVGLVLGHDGIDPALRVGVKKGDGVTWITMASVSPGWHTFSIRLDQDAGRWTPYWNGGALSAGDTLPAATLDRLHFGDRSVSNGQGLAYLDDVQVLPLNAPPVAYVSAPAEGASVPRGVVQLSGVVADVDPADAPDRLEIVIDGQAYALPNAHSWTYAWDASALAPGSVHKVTVRAYQVDGRVLYAESPERTFTLT